MPNEVKKRGRPPKKQIEQIAETNTAIYDTEYEFNSFVSNGGLIDAVFSCGIFNYFSKNQIDNILRDPITYHEEAIKLSNFVYGKNGIVANSIDYMVSLPCLDKIIINKNQNKSQESTEKIKTNKELMQATLNTIGDKTFIRNALFTEALDGIAFFYLETRKKAPDNKNFLTDYDIERITEINALDDTSVNVAIISLPWQYTRIVGKKNGRYVLAFNLRYFDDWTGDSLDRKLRKYPQEIVDAYNKRHKDVASYGDWCILNSDRTMCRKIKCKDTEPWGRSLIIAALEDVLYKDYFVDTKRHVLDEVNNKIIYQTFPEGKEKGTCALTKQQQETQHATVKQAVMNKNSRNSMSFFSVAAGTKLDSLDVDIDIFDSKNESDLNNQISLDLGICASLIGAMSTGNFAAGQSNLEMITAQLYTWVYEWQNELNYVINKNIIKDEKHKVEVYYFPTSFVNRQSFFDMMRSLYSEASGSMRFLIASTGVDPDSYLSVLDEEIAEGYFEKYLPHQTAYTNNGKNTNSNGGRPTIDNPTNENTLQTRANKSNEMPKPSTQ